MTIQAGNRIIIIGNGFDLAHDAKTSYLDFSDHLLNTIIPDELIKHVRNIEGAKLPISQDLARYIHGKGGFVSHSIKNIIAYAKSGVREGLSEEIKKSIGDLPKILGNSLLVGLYRDKPQNWFEIENTYFNQLKIIYNTKIGLPQKKDQLQKLNIEFDWIRKELIKYLKGIDINVSDKVRKVLHPLLTWRGNTYIINFNYTHTIEKYLDELGRPENVKLNYVHGDLTGGEIVFGYGNDQNQEYQLMKETEQKEYLRNFKTFRYLRNKRYSKVELDCIEKFNRYEVCVLGHSLGLTDKTLLQELLDNEKCVSIKIYRRPDKSKDEQPEYYDDLTMALSRIMSTERDVRKKVNEFTESDFFPAQ